MPECPTGTLLPGVVVDERFAELGRMLDAVDDALGQGGPVLVVADGVNQHPGG